LQIPGEENQVDFPIARISVVIPTYRRPALLARCLDALIAQTLPGHAFEVIVVDDGATEDTRATCIEVAARSRERGGPAIRYLRPQGTRGPAAARNRGWRAAVGRIVGFTDDDTIPDRDWLRLGETALEIDGVQAAWGRVHVPMPPALTDNARNTAGLENAVFVTANAFVRHNALRDVGGFDERYRRAWREDTDLYFALVQRFGSAAVVAMPSALVLHPVRDTRFLVSIGQQANMAFDALLFKKYPALYDRHIGLRHPPALYAMIVLATLVAIACWPVSADVALVGLAIAVAGVIGFAMRRLHGLAKSPRLVADMLISSIAIPFVSLWWRCVGAWRWRVAFF
jgi:glycosyltransferase involved in cell wall biosynthesis